MSMLGSDNGGANRNRYWWQWSLIGTCVVVAAVWWQTHPSPIIDPKPNGVVARDESVERDESVVSSPGFLGPQACAECHTEHFAEFQKTRHFLSCVTPQAQAMLAGFNAGSNSFATRNSKLRFEMTREDDEFIQTAIHHTLNGEMRTASRIAFVYGTQGPYDEMYLAWHGDGLYQLPLSWLHPSREWGANRFDPYGSGHFAFEVPARCLECHNTWFQHVAGTINRYDRENFVLGVTCEVCHGPGRDHVAFHRQNPDAVSTQGTVNPERLPRDRQLDLCAQCHSNATKSCGPAFRYRPGEPVAKYFQISDVHNPEEDHVANQVQHMSASLCFQKSDTLTCTTCHNPHRAASATNAGSESCRKCHPSTDCGEQERLPMAVRGDCIGCHMPKRTKPRIHYRTEREAYVMPGQRRDHRIAIDPIARDQVLLAWHQTQAEAGSRDEAARLARALGEHWLTTADRLRREHRYLAAIDAYRQAQSVHPAEETQTKLAEVLQIQTKLDDDWQTAVHQIAEQRLDEAITTLNGILELKPSHAAAHGRLGMLYAVKKRDDLAREHLQAVAQYDPGDQYGESMLGWLAFLQGRWEESRQHYARADEIEPFNAKINFQLAANLVQLDRLPDAIEHFRKTLTIAPQHIEACRGLSFALRRQGRAKEALPFAKRAARLTDSRNLELLVELAEISVEAGDLTEAGAAATQALNLAKSSNQPLGRRQRSRLEDLRTKAPKANE